jgi:hypothetical protein
MNFTHKMSGLSYDFKDKAVSPWGGLRLMEEIYRRSGLKQYLEEECEDLPVPGSNRGYISRKEIFLKIKTIKRTIVKIIAFLIVFFSFLNIAIIKILMVSLIKAMV